METDAPQRIGGIRKNRLCRVGHCLYRFNGWYYARFKRDHKEIKQSLHTQDFAQAKRKLREKLASHGKADLTQAKATLAELCDKYLSTLTGLKAKTLAQAIRRRSG